MKPIVAVSLLLFLAVWAQAKPPFDLQKFTSDIMGAAKTAMENFKTFKPEDIKELMANLKSPQEQKAFVDVIQGFLQGKSDDDLLDILMETKSGPLLAEKMLPLLEKYKDLREKYGKAFRTAANKKT